MYFHIKSIFSIAILVIVVGLSNTSAATSRFEPAVDKDKSKPATLQAAMRKLWEDHITWTRVFIISAAGDLPDKDAATQRLLQNQVDIGNAIKPYYGVAAGDKLTALLTNHILIAADLLTALDDGDSAAFAAANTAWYANA